MTRGLRLALLVPGLALLAALIGWGAHSVPKVGAGHGPYAGMVTAAAQRERNVTDAVTAVNFDYRAIDTVGEEYVLFISVAAVAVVLRMVGRDRSGGVGAEARRAAPTSDAVRLMSLAMVAPTIVLGVYIVAHGQLSPGGGFQGGVIAASATLLVYLAGRYRRMRRVGGVDRLEVADALGAGGFVLIGLAAMLGGAAFLTNVLPLGNAGDLTAGGTIPLISVSIGIEVAAGFVVVLSEFLEQTAGNRGGVSR